VRLGAALAAAAVALFVIGMVTPIAVPALVASLGCSATGLWARQQRRSAAASEA
jgi:hypothetical protein